MNKHLTPVSSLRSLRSTWIAPSLTALLATALIAGCGGPAGPNGQGSSAPLQLAPRADASTTRVFTIGADDVAATAPRFSPDGMFLVYAAGEPGARDIYLWSLGEQSPPIQLTSDPGDDADPTWNRDGSAVVFASNRDGDYDLYEVPIMSDAGSEVQLTNLAGDERAPTVNPLMFSFSGVRYDYCTSDGVSTEKYDEYSKIAFVRESATGSSVWFTSPDGVHQGQISADGLSCKSPAWADNGLKVTWECAGENGSLLYEAPAAWTQDLMAALQAIDVPGADADPYVRESFGCEWFDEEAGWQADECMQSLQRQYAVYGQTLVSETTPGLQTPTISANQTVLVAAGPPGTTTLYHRNALGALATDQTWASLDVQARDPRSPDWSPDGKRLAFDGIDENGVRRIFVAEVDFYLKMTRNLIDFPELQGAQQSELLSQNGLMARPGTEKEFFEAYEKLRYKERPQYITVDAALQAYRDEFVRMLRDAEDEARGDLLTMTAGLSAHYLKKLETTRDISEVDRFLAVYFTVPWVILTAYEQTPGPTGEDYYMGAMGGDPEEWMEPEEIEAYRTRKQPRSERVGAQIDTVLATVPEVIRADVKQYVELSLSHGGVTPVPVPGIPDGAMVDFSQFKVRGHYEDMPDYFLAVSWLSHVPMVFDGELAPLAAMLVDTTGPDAELAKSWLSIDALMGAFMGRPVDATMQHVHQLATEEPGLFAPFDAKAVKDRLAELRGPVPVRGTEGATRGGDYPLRVSLLPKRLGTDVIVISKVTHPNVSGRPFPAAMDVMAAMGSERALAHATTAEAEEAWAAEYQQALVAVGLGEASALAPTDIYHAWLATLLVLANGAEIPDTARVRFANSAAWSDRLLYTSLAGYAQLKHSSVLYAMQESGIECDGSSPVQILVEQPIIPMPRGYVEPHPEFFRQLATLSGRIYADLNEGEAPQTYDWHAMSDDGDEEPMINAQVWAEQLAVLADKQNRGIPLTKAEYGWIAHAGARMEAMFFAGFDAEVFMGGTTRLEHGVKLVADIYTNVQRGEVVELGVGPLMDIYAAVPHPDGAGEQIAQGAMLSFYEFRAAMSDRLNDTQWHERVMAGDLPPLPPWTHTFIEMPALEAAAPRAPMPPAGPEAPPSDPETPPSNPETPPSDPETPRSNPGSTK